MKTLILSMTVAGAMGAFAMGPANAAPIATHGVIVAPAGVTDVACRTVKKTVVRNGVRRVTTTKQCDGMGRPGYRSGYVQRRPAYYGRPVYRRPAPRPGVSIGIGVR